MGTASVFRAELPCPRPTQHEVALLAAGSEVVLHREPAAAVCAWRTLQLSLCTHLLPDVGSAAWGGGLAPLQEQRLVGRGLEERPSWAPPLGGGTADRPPTSACPAARPWRR